MGAHARWIGLPVPLLVAAGALANPLDPPTPGVLVEARRIVQEMSENQRGPYSRIEWFCNDGTVQPPVAFACRERGGGRQHAGYSEARQELQTLGWSVGTIFAATTFEELVESQPRQQRLRELALERYLVDIDNGWVLRRAQYYRGRVQVEDEDYTGRGLLNQLLADASWAQENFLLVRESARVIPHGQDTDLARTVRRAAIELAELDPSAEKWRVEIHTSPTASTAGRLRAWLATKQAPEVLAAGEALAANLDLLYGSEGRRARIEASLNELRRAPIGAQWSNSVVSALEQTARRQVRELCSALSAARGGVFGALPIARRLALVDAMQGLETEVQLAFQELGPLADWPRQDLLKINGNLVECAYGSGLLSANERTSLLGDLDFQGRDEISLVEYRQAIARLKRAPAWAIGNIRYTFAEALVRYVALDPRAARFSDDVLRGSPMWMLGDTLKVMAFDVDRLSGSSIDIAGHSVGTAVALNSGIARGKLRIFETNEEVAGAHLEATDIVALPETIAELEPVAGILTLGEGNALSHVQLLARNFGIPNVAVDMATIDLLRPLAGEQVVLVVGSRGNVVLRPYDDEAEQLMAAPGASASSSDFKIEVPVPNLEADSVLSLAELGRQLSGKVVGPKAANLGELNRLFPGRVAPAVAIPFGIYAAHLDRAGLMQRIRAAFQGRDDGSVGADELAKELASVRSAIAAIEIAPDTLEEIADAMLAEFGEPGSYGVFVRSDTNVEDLPQFTGAGLNETIPNVVGFDLQLAAIPRVWSSVLSPRALAWRSNVLANPADIYASVLLMKSVPANKSGVLVTSNLFNREAAGMTASVAWGVGGAVAGEAAESIVIMDEDAEMIFEAKSPYRRSLAPGGGVEYLPADSGSVLLPDEIQQLRELALEVAERYEPAYDESGNARPWDIEFGFIDGELTLFQIRPLVERAGRNADLLLHRLRPDLPPPTPGHVMVRLDQATGTLTEEQQ